MVSYIKTENQRRACGFTEMKMKKRIIALIIAAASVFSLLGGCASGRSPLTFNNAFHGGGDTGSRDADPKVGYEETLVYDVFANASDYQYKKDSTLTDDIIKYEITGSYTVTLKVLSDLDEETKTKFTTDITKPDGAAVYSLKTELKLTAKYSGKAEFTHDDKITSETYFYPFTESFMPLYSKTDSEYVNVSAGNGSAALSVIKSFSEIIYRSSSYTVNSRAIQYPSDGEARDLAETELKTSEHKYSSKTVIDNAQLFFALRNVKVDVDGTYTLPVVSSAYGDPTDLAVKNLQEFDDDAAFSYKGTDYSGKVKVKELAYYVNSQNTTGSRQFVYIQKAAVKDGDNTVVENRALPVKMVFPMIAYGSFSRLGSLVYKLTSVTAA